MNELLPIDRNQFFDLPPTREHYRNMKRQRDIALTAMAILAGITVWLAWYVGSISGGAQ